jgi:hypothetical protein
MRFFEERDKSFVECFACAVYDLSEAGLRWGEGVADLDERFCDSAGGGAGEANDADATAAGWGGDGYDGVVVFRHFFMVLCQYFLGGFLVVGGVFLEGDCDFHRCFCVVFRW